jgi:hypothetical protein
MSRTSYESTNNAENKYNSYKLSSPSSGGSLKAEGFGDGQYALPDYQIKFYRALERQDRRQITRRPPPLWQEGRLEKRLSPN